MFLALKISLFSRTNNIDVVDDKLLFLPRSIADLESEPGLFLSNKEVFIYLLLSY